MPSRRDPVPALDDVIALLDRRYDPAVAEGWDAVGLVVGDPAAPVRRVLFAVDPVRAVVDEAIAWAADLLVVHHPLLLRPVHAVAATTPKGSVVHDLIRSGVALLVAHTNADIPSGGVSQSMADAFGLLDARPLEPSPAPDAAALDKVVVMVPSQGDHLDRVRDALFGAGAGRLGDYEHCSFVSTGTGSFRPRPGARPAVGAVGSQEHVAEARLEVVAPRSARSEVVTALRAAHPYEQPAFDVLELVDDVQSRGVTAAPAGHGRVGRLPRPEPLAAFVQRVVAALPATASAVRVAGDPDREVRTVALCGGSGDGLLDRAHAAGADVYVTSDLRHHPASEALEHPGAPALIDVPHWAAEWTWLPVAAAALETDLTARGTTVEIRVSTLVTDPWTDHVPMTGDSRP